ncbi:hypothetical protein RvY_07272 [Ramazzottius varieornatus]|uniref:Uncharacterized protein n=1 Tax=Ramazzottius varieornatus TaxID=947166 RepID=A0A1D1V1H6_RAMVA|nr:hypothetical protein RvY_07272 [Ramazzottius varieornatus]
MSFSANFGASALGCLLLATLISSAAVLPPTKATLKPVAKGSLIAVNNWNCEVVATNVPLAKPTREQLLAGGPANPACSNDSGSSSAAGAPRRPVNGDNDFEMKPGKLMQVGNICCKVTTQRSGGK